MAAVYFDITNVVEFAKRTNTVIGIPRVQLNIVKVLAAKHGGDRIRGTFYDYRSKQMFAFDPLQLDLGFAFESERLLCNLGLAEAQGWLPAKGQVKSYLRQFSHSKVLRTWKKIEVYWSAVFQRDRLRALGFRLGDDGQRTASKISLSHVNELPADSAYVLLGAIWLLPELWSFARQHRNRGGVVVQMVYDLIPLIYPDYYTSREPPAFKAWLDDALEYTTRFVCISKWTDDDLKKYAADRGVTVQSKPVPLAHEFAGYGRDAQIAAPKQLADLIGREYVLCVGTIEHRKNNLLLLKIWQKLLATMPERVPLLVFGGKLGRGGAEFQALLDGDSELRRHVRVVHSPSDEDLAWLYQHCLFTAFPSQFEGWGLPVGEAAWFGKYTVASKVTSVPEVCGDLVDYVDPFNDEDVEQGIVKPILDRQFLETRERAIRGASLRSWQDVATDIFAAIESG